MSASNKNTLSPEMQEMIVNNFQNHFPLLTDKKIIRKVLTNENWNFEKSFNLLKKLNQDLGKNQNKNEKAKSMPESGPSSQKKTRRERKLEKETTLQNSSNNQTKQQPESKPVNAQSGKKTKQEKKIKKEIALQNNNNNNSIENPVVPILGPNERMVLTGVTVKCNPVNKKKVEKPEHQQQQQKSGKLGNLSDKKQSRSDIKQLYDSYKGQRDPFNRIIGYSNSKIKVMVFMRGCPGSGKSTYAYELLKKLGILDPKWSVYSADDFFIDDSTGVYTFKPELIASAHEWNQNLVKQAAIEGRSPIIIDNTHTRLWEMKDNATVGVEYGYIIETLEPKTPWFFVENQLFKKTTHNVSRENILRMIERYEPNLTGLDVINLLGLTYIRPPPIRQIIDSNSPPSKKSLKLYDSKNLIKTEVEYPAYTDGAKKIYSYKPPRDIYRLNRVSQPSDKSNLTLINSSIQKNTNDNLRYCKNEMPSIYQTNRMALNEQPTTSQISSTNSQRKFPNVFHFGFTEDVAKNWVEEDASTPFWSLTSKTDQNQIDDDKNTNLAKSKDLVDNITTSYDLINLNQEENESSVSPEKSFNSAAGDESQLPYYAAYYANFQNEEVSSSESSHSDSEDDDNEDEDEEEGDDNEEEDEYDVDSLDELKCSTNSSFSSIDSDVVSSKNLISEYNEYVLIMEDEKILYQKEHHNFPTNLNDFKSYCPTENIVSSVVSTDEIKIDQKPHNFSIYEYVLIQPDQTLLYQKIHSDEPDNLIDFLKKSEKNLNEIIDENLELTSQNNNKEEKSNNDNIKLVEDELVSINTELATAKVDVNIRKVMDASSNTNYIDFEILKQINSGDNACDDRKDVITGSPFFESLPFTNNNSKQISSVLMLDKSSMTYDIQTNQINNANIGVDSLVKIFPSINRENLEELLSTCNNDLDWAVGLLLDSGHEMSECVPDIKESETAVFNDDNNINLENTDSNHSPTTISPPDTTNTSTSESSRKTVCSDKKKKKRTAALNDDSLDLLLNFQDKFKLNEEHYSEYIMKLRKSRLPINDELQPTTSQEFGLLTTNEDLKEIVEIDTEKEVERFNEKIEEEEEEEEEEEDKESDVSLVMDKNWVIQLQNKFGGLLSPNLIGDKTVLRIPKSLARQLYCYTFDAVYEHFEQQQAVIDMLIKESRFNDETKNESLKNQPSFQEIMDYEVALRMSQVKDNSRANTAASTLSRTLLLERFPNFDTSTLTSILEDTNHSLHAATNLLTLAGHPAKPEETQIAKKEETQPLSREEAIQQAQAYSDVVGKLYDMREDCLAKAENALAEGKNTVAQYYSEMAKWYMERIEKSNSLAANAMLNGHEGATTLDLHFLQVNEALKVLDLFLDDKIRALSNKRKLSVYIITGRGSHSPRGLCKIKQAVQARLRKRQISFSEQNPGMLRAYITKRALVSYKKLIT